MSSEAAQAAVEVARDALALAKRKETLAELDADGQALLVRYQEAERALVRVHSPDVPPYKP